MMSGFFLWFKGLFRRDAGNAGVPLGDGGFYPERVAPNSVQPTWHDVPRTEAGNADLLWMYERMQLRNAWGPRVAQAAALIRGHRDRYVRVQEETGVPWMVVGVIHYLEAACDFKKHLHNGDPLSGKTVRVPAGRPPLGSPPFNWTESAVDAVSLKGWHHHQAWTTAQTLDRLETYNGLGYRKYHKDVPTPYLWSGTTFYEKGKYVADGKFDRNAVSAQVGAAPLLQALHFNGYKRGWTK